MVLPPLRGEGGFLFLLASGAARPRPAGTFFLCKKCPTLGLRASLRSVGLVYPEGTSAPAYGRVKHTKTYGLGIPCLIGLGVALSSSSHWMSDPPGI